MAGVEDLTLVILQQIRGDIQDLRTDMNERFDTTNQRIDATNERIDATNQRIDDTNRHLEGLAAQQRLLTRYITTTLTDHEHQLAELRALAHKH